MNTILPRKWSTSPTRIINGALSRERIASASTTPTTTTSSVIASTSRTTPHIHRLFHSSTLFLFVALPFHFMKGISLVEKALRSLIQVHITLFEHGIDLLIGLVPDHLLELLHYFLGAGRNLDGSASAGTHDDQSRQPHPSLPTRAAPTPSRSTLRALSESVDYPRV